MKSKRQILLGWIADGCDRTINAIRGSSSYNNLPPDHPDVDLMCEIIGRCRVMKKAVNELLKDEA